MDSEFRAPTTESSLSAEDGRAGPNSGCKLARSDTFPFRMQLQNAEFRASLVRSNSSIMPEYRPGVCSCSASSTPCSNADSHRLFVGGDGSFLSDARQVRNESLISASRIAALQEQQQQLPSFRAAGQFSAFGDVERAGEGSQLHPHFSPLSLFTSSQLRELQLQALIFKHMVCGVNVPPELVLHVRTSVAALARFTTGAAHLGSIGWGNYQLGYGGSEDAEPGRCRRTDGKKWRCARDVVPDQKYCERHIHRGRHRARKPPEPPPLPTASTSASPSPSAITALPVSGVGTPSRLAFLGDGAYNCAAAAAANIGREGESQPLRHFFNDWPAGRGPSSLTWPDTQGSSSEQQKFPVYGSGSASATELSISTDMHSAFVCDGVSSRRGKLALSPLKLSMSRGEDDPLGVEAATQMGLALGLNETDRQGHSGSSWVPVTWATGNAGGPLAEVLQSSGNAPRGAGSHAMLGVRPSELNLMSEAWGSSPRSDPPSSSPTGVLQTSASFGCFSSDNSTGSSPRSAALKQP